MIPVLYTTFNRLGFTKQTLPVLIKNTPEAEIIVIDNGSTDGTAEYLIDCYESQGGINHLVLKGWNSGICGAMNTFFEMTEDAEYVAKVDNDTLVPPNWLTDLLRVFNAVPLEMVQAKHYFHSTVNKDWADLVSKRPSRQLGNGSLVYAKYVGGSGVVFRRDIITEPLVHDGLNGWGNFQYHHKEHRRAMFDAVWIDLLDMADYNTYTDDIDIDYFLSTGRFERPPGFEDVQATEIPQDA